MEEALPELSRTRQDGLLLDVDAVSPEPVVRRSPVLSIISSWSLLMSGDLDAVESRLDDAEAAMAAGAQDQDLAATWADTDHLRTAPATVSVYRASLAQARGDVAGTVRHARHALDLAGPGGPSSAAPVAVSSAWPRGHLATLRRHCRRSPMRCAVCTPRATSSTRWTPRWCSPTWVASGAGRAAPAGYTSRRCNRHRRRCAVSGNGRPARRSGRARP